ncbi:Threonine/homoserine/homoserine lactone efflux protein [Lutimaribacter pacificus]|uniref:Threonine/homoserine/homoserine lactone efflux protein n=1 Tax=Lutimaribacter pacificus TaxID=391948 RepID=A0A1H0GQD9_9RHOB|nr:LysE family translocator [Lutimaribacter pacificus]SDO09266.1 Threonine/homoserine/homoserine lactone efflux protein [Lutimaribacter pacificus]SHJ90684.1 Threonine/homoserine/homoserine lactone efflux protein [Lutimaribacter pacificus]
MLATLAAMEPATVVTFLLAGVMLNLTPGADVMFAMASGAQGGPRAGMAAALGVALGSVLHVTLAVLGVSAAILAIPHAHDAIRYLGAAYLFWLAVKAWRAPPPDPRQGAARTGRAVWRGFVTNALNPKVALFIMAFLPQFTDPAIGPVWQQMAVLGAMFTLTGLAITGAYGAGAGWLGTAVGRASGVMGKLSALVFGALAARIVMD